MKRIESYERKGGSLTKYNLLKKEKKGGAYNKGRIFFGIHWEIQHKSPNKVRLHIESPVFEQDQKLNEIKTRVINSFLTSPIGDLSTSEQLDFEPGKRVSAENIKSNKSTEIFKIILSKGQIKNSNEENILFIDNLLGLGVQDIYFKFIDELLGIF